MDKARVSVVAEVQRGQVEEIQDKDDLGPDEVGANEEHDPCELEKVVEDEVAANAGGCVDVGVVGREEGPDVADLENEEDEPVFGQYACECEMRLC